MNPEDPDDVELLQALWRGELTAFEMLYRRHAPTVMRYAWARLSDRAAAEEILQETFLTVWKRHGSATIVDLSLLPWLLTIAGNHLRNAVRRQSRHKTLPFAELPERSRGDGSTLVAIRIAPDELSEIDRRICELCLVEGFSYREAAAEVELTEAAIRKRLQRARGRLRQSLSNTNE